MTARPQDVALLPFPEFVPIGSSWNDTILNFAANYARANVIAALASAQAREEELRARFDRACAVAMDRAGRLAESQARAERMAQALRAAEALAVCCMSVDGYSRLEIRDMAAATIPKFSSALSTNAAQPGERT